MHWHPSPNPRAVEQTTSLDPRSPKDRGLAHCLAVAGRSGRDVLMRATGKRPWFPRDSHACGDVALCLCEPPRVPPRLHICHFTHALTSTTANHASNILRPLQPLPHAALPWRACTLAPSCKHCGACTCGLCPSLRGSPHLSRRVAINANRNGTRASVYTFVLIDDCLY